MLLTALFRLLLVEVPNRVNVVQKYLDTAYLAKKPKEAVLELMKTLLMAGFEFSHTLGRKQTLRQFDLTNLDERPQPKAVTMDFPSIYRKFSHSIFLVVRHNPYRTDYFFSIFNKVL